MADIYLSQTKITETNLGFYMDSQLRDDKDYGRASYRSSSYLQLRQKLELLSDRAFNKVSDAMFRLVDSYLTKDKVKDNTAKDKARMQEVFERVSNYLNSTTEEVSRVQ